MPKSRRPTQPKALRRSLSTGRAARALLCAVTRDLDRHLTRLMTTRDPQSAHKTRIALRRLRALLAAFKPLFRRKLHADLTLALRGLFQRIGILRDAQVLAETAAPADRPDLQARIKPLRRHLIRDLKAAQAAGLPPALQALFSGKAWVAKGDLRHGAVTPFAATALQKVWDKCRASDGDLTRQSDDARHALRKRLKTLRYLASDFAPLWPGANGMITPLAALQDGLGQLNDLSLAKTRGLTIDTDQVLDLLTAADAEWRILCGVTPFWQARA